MKTDARLVNTPRTTFETRQQTPKVFDITTVVYIVKSNFILKNTNLFEGTVIPVHIPLERSIDIDTIHDFKIAEYLMMVQES